MNTFVKEPYPSRVLENPMMLRRQEPILWQDMANKPDWISAEQLEHYDQNGFLVLTDLFSPDEVAQLQQSSHALMNKFQHTEVEGVIREPSSNIVRSLFNLPTHSKEFDQLTRHPKLIELAQFILDSPVYLHQSRLNYKPAFHGKEFFWHSDFETWHIEDGMPAMRALSCSVLLTDNNEHNGPLMVIPASHRTYVSCVGTTPDKNYVQSLRQQQIGTPAETMLTTLATLGGGIQSIKGKAGTVVLFDCNLLHGSSGNISPDPRSNAFFVYNSTENALKEPFHNLAERPDYVAHRTVKAL
jgi:ectoine hydroxylase